MNPDNLKDAHAEIDRLSELLSQYCERSGRLAHELVFWQGKHAIVRHENNVLRRRLYKRDGKKTGNEDRGAGPDG